MNLAFRFLPIIKLIYAYIHYLFINRLLKYFIILVAVALGLDSIDQVAPV